MNTVQSKYKNPDKYIEKLKAGLEWQTDRKRALFGVHQFGYSSGVTKSVVFSSPKRCRALFPGSEVRFTGQVKTVKRDMDKGTEITFELSQCYLTEEG